MPTSGYSVVVSNVTTDGASIHVSIENVAPGPRCFVLQVSTNPFVFVKIPKSALPVSFQHDPMLLAC